MGWQEISIREFLKGLLKGEVRCLHEKSELEAELRSGDDHKSKRYLIQQILVGG